MSVSGVNSLNNMYTTETDSTIKDKSGLGIDDFFQLMAAQLQNQSMFDTVDNTQFITQMAQFSTLSQMTELVSTFKTNAAVSLLGKNVNVMTSDENGQPVFVTGSVQQISFVDGKPMLYVKDGFYELSAVTDISADSLTAIDAQDDQSSSLFDSPDSTESTGTGDFTDTSSDTAVIDKEVGVV